MKQYNLSRLISDTESSLISYLASALPIGNHKTQEKLGAAFYELWEEKSFNGPYVEFLPRYKIRCTLSSLLDGALHGRDDALFRRRFLPKCSWEDVDSRMSRYLRPRRQLWEDGTAEAEEEREHTTLDRLCKLGLYAHQDKAIKRVVRDQKSVLVATGTGSGKTECFLVPLLYELLTEPEDSRSRAGVRALLLYPMNALVEDQMARLRRLLFWINLQGLNSIDPVARLERPITFGRYTGETPVSYTDCGHDRSVSDEEIRELGEVLYRQDMQSHPPDILVTNFTMLEYMLLRNDDSKLFQAPDLLKFLILDEIHTYHGTRGMEVATLLRRFRDYVSRRQDQSATDYMCIGLSATLSSEPKAERKMARFASQLFGTDFDSASIIVGEIEPIDASADSKIPPSSKVKEILNLPILTPQICCAFALDHRPDDVEDGEVPVEEWRSLATILGSAIPSQDYFSTNPERTEILGKILRLSPLFERLKNCIAGLDCGVGLFDEIAKSLFGAITFGAEPQGCKRALAILFQLVMGGYWGGKGLLSLRAHLFVKEHKQAHLCVNRDHAHERGSLTDGWWSELFAVHRQRCEQCNSLVYPVYLCRKCGFVVLEGWRRKGTILPEKDDLLGSEKFHRVLLRPLESVAEHLQEKLLTEEPSTKIISLCTWCGQRFPHEDNNAAYLQAALQGHADKCPHTHIIEAIEWSADDGDARIMKCPYCDQDWFKGQEVITAPTLSLYTAATILLEEIKRAIDEPLKDTGCIQKILSFSDGRQQAAFIAARLQRTNEDFTFRQLLYQTLSESDRPMSTKAVIAHLSEQLEADIALQQLFCEPGEIDDPGMIRRRMATLLFRDTNTEYRTLESLCVSSVLYPENIFSPASTVISEHPLGRRLSDPERHALAVFILNWGFRFNRWAVTPGSFPLFLPDLEGYGFQDRSICKLSAGPNTSGLSLKQENKRNRLWNLYRRVCERDSGARFLCELTSFKQLVESLWTKVLADSQFHVRRRVGQPLSDSKPLVVIDGNDPDTYKLKLNWTSLRWVAEPDDSPLYRCGACGYLTRIYVRGVCPVRNCVGHLEETSLGQVSQRTFSPARHYLRLLRKKQPKALRVEEHTAQISPRARREIEKEFRDDSVGSIDIISGSTTFELGIDLGSVNAVLLANMPPEISNYRQRAGRAGRRPGMLPLVLTYVRERPHDSYFWNRAKDFIGGPLRIPRFSAPSHEVLLRHINAVLFAHLLETYPDPGGLEGPRPAEAFVRYCIEPSRKALLNQQASDTQTGLGRSIRTILDANTALHLGPAECIKNFYERLEHIQSAYMPLRANDGAISVFSDYGILPSYNYPIYVDELRLYQCARTERPRCNLKLQRDRIIALSEYYPGRIIVAGKVVIKSLGLWNGFRLLPFLYCKRCSHIETQQNGQLSDCPNGCGPMVRRQSAKPLGGFLGKYESGVMRQDPELLLVRGGQFLFDPQGSPPPTFENRGKALKAARQSSFFIQKSGARMRTFTPRPDSERPLHLARASLRDVAVPGFQRYDCLVLPEIGNGPSEDIYLMHEFTTDILRLQLSQSHVGSLLASSDLFSTAMQSPDPAEKEKAETILLWTLGQALTTGGSRLLEIDPRELAFTFRRTAGNLLLNREIILFDTASGGAGYCDQLYDRLNLVFEKAAEVLHCRENCGDSCYSCLRSYENQAIHSRLNRFYLIEGLKRFNSANWATKH